MMRIVIALVVATVAVVTTAAAEDRAAGERYFRAGAAAYAAQNFAAAATNFEEAYKALPLPEIAFSAAQAYRKLYRTDPQPTFVRRAVELYRLYLDKIKTGARVGDAVDNLADMERELDKLEARGIKVKAAGLPVAERTRIGVNVSVAAQRGAAVREVGDLAETALPGLETTLDGKPLEPYALVDVAAGDHVIVVRANGFFEVEKRHRAVAGVSTLVDVELVAKPAKLAITTIADAQVTVDGRPASSHTVEVAAGRHVVTVLRAGRQPWGREIEVVRGQTLALAAPLAKTAKRRAAPWLIIGASGLAAIATGCAIGAVVADGRASDRKAEIDRGNASAAIGDDYHHQVGLRDDLRTAAIGFGAVATLTAAVGIALYVFDKPSTESLRLAPVAGRDGAGVAALGRF